MVRANQWRAPAALSSGVVGAGGVLIVRALWELIDGRQLMVVRVVLLIVIQACKSGIHWHEATLSTWVATSDCLRNRVFY